jgi:hexaprenyl-diphosphate synthase
MRRWPGSIHFSPLAATRSHYPRNAFAQQSTKHTQATVPPEQNVASRVSARPDPYKLMQPQLTHLRTTLLDMLGSSDPALTEIAKYYFLHPSKQIRPLIVLLFAQATNGLGREWTRKRWAAEVEGGGATAAELDQPLTRPDVLNDWNPNMPDHTASFESVFSLRSPRPLRETIVPPPRPEDSQSATDTHKPHTHFTDSDAARADCGDDPCRITVA